MASTGKGTGSEPALLTSDALFRLFSVIGIRPFFLGDCRFTDDALLTPAGF